VEQVNHEAAAVTTLLKQKHGSCDVVGFQDVRVVGWNVCQSDLVYATVFSNPLQVAHMAIHLYIYI